MHKTICCSLAAALMTTAAAGQDMTPENTGTRETGELRPFVLPWDDTRPSGLDLSFLSPDPAGAAGPVRIEDDGHLYSGDQRLRLWGNNITGGTVFADNVTDEQRNAFAGRMRKFGYNAIRYHHLGATWLDRNIFGPVRQSRNESTTQIDPESLDRLQRWFAAFKRHGLYTNMNLLVSRRFVAADGVPGIDAVGWKLQGTIAMWHPRLIELQKEYARQLLASDNPHTGLPIARDPSLATVEINNENGILHAWFGGQLDEVPADLAEPLRIAWNDWLRQRYASDAALAKAWQARDVPLGKPLVDGPNGFVLERHGGAAAQAESADGETRITVQRPGAMGWHVQWGRPGLAFSPDQPYTLRFEARADRARSINVNVGEAHAPWGGLGFSQNLKLTPDWQRFEFVFVPTRGDDNGRVIFSGLSQEGARFALRSVSLHPGGRVGGTTNLGAVPLPSHSAGQGQTAPQRRDFIAFCMEAERAYFGQMRQFLREELGVTAPVVGTIVGCSPMGVQKEMDAIDTHAYWRHPEFPGRGWDPDNWIVRPDSMVNHPRSSAILGTMLKQVRINGKRLPHMLTEYDHPAPNPYAGEGPLFLAAYAALQDYDAVYLFCYDHNFRNDGGRITGYFDTMNHPTVAANALAAALLFRRGDIAPAQSESVVTITPEQELDALTTHGQAWRMVDYADFVGRPLDAYTQRVAVNFAAASAMPAPFSVPGGLAADNGALVWTPPTDDAEGRLHLLGRTVLGGIGPAPESAPIGHPTGPRLVVPDGRWATVILCQLEGSSLLAPGRKRALLVATRGHANAGWVWKDEQRQMLTDWGRAPTLIETVPVILALPGEPAIRAWALDPIGQRVEPVTGERVDGQTMLRLGPGHTETATLWYEIEWE